MAVQVDPSLTIASTTDINKEKAIVMDETKVDEATTTTDNTSFTNDESVQIVMTDDTSATTPTITSMIQTDDTGVDVVTSKELVYKTGGIQTPEDLAFAAPDLDGGSIVNPDLEPEPEIETETDDDTTDQTPDFEPDLGGTTGGTTGGETTWTGFLEWNDVQYDTIEDWYSYMSTREGRTALFNAFYNSGQMWDEATNSFVDSSGRFEYQMGEESFTNPGMVYNGSTIGTLSAYLNANGEAGNYYSIVDGVVKKVSSTTEGASYVAENPYFDDGRINTYKSYEAYTEAVNGAASSTSSTADNDVFKSYSGTDYTETQWDVFINSQTELGLKYDVANNKFIEMTDLEKSESDVYMAANPDFELSGEGAESSITEESDFFEPFMWNDQMIDTKDEWDTIVEENLRAYKVWDEEAGTFIYDESLKIAADLADASTEHSYASFSLLGMDGLDGYIPSWTEDAIAKAEAQYGVEVAQAAQDALAARQELASSRAAALNSFYGAEYASASMIDKFGWSGSAEDDVAMRTAYLQASINAQMLNQKELVLAGYESDLAVAREYANVQLTQLAQDAYAQAQANALSLASITGVYISPEMQDITSNYLAMSDEEKTADNPTYNAIMTFFAGQGLATYDESLKAWNIDEVDEWVKYFNEHTTYAKSTELLMTEEAIAAAEAESATIDLGNDTEAGWMEGPQAYYNSTTNQLYNEDTSKVDGMDNYIVEVWSNGMSYDAYRTEPHSDLWIAGDGNLYNSAGDFIQTAESYYEDIDATDAYTITDMNVAADLLVDFISEFNTNDWKSSDFNEILTQDPTTWTVKEGLTLDEKVELYTLGKWDDSMNDDETLYTTLNGITITERQYNWLKSNWYDKQ